MVRRTQSVFYDPWGLGSVNKIRQLSEKGRWLRSAHGRARAMARANSNTAPQVRDPRRRRGAGGPAPAVPAGRARRRGRGAGSAGRRERVPRARRVRWEPMFVLTRKKKMLDEI